MIWRYRFILVILLCSFLTVVVRLYYWQVVRAQELSDIGFIQYGRQIKILSKRGEIIASDNYPLVTNKISYLVFANPKEIKDKKKTTQVLSLVLSEKEASISASLSKDLFWVPLKSSVDLGIKEKLEKLKLRGIGFEKQYARFYPEASMASTLTGFVGKDEGGEDKGYYGLEGYYDRQLRGKGGIVFQIHDALGKPILSRQSGSPSTVDGRSIILTIHRPIQFIAERILRQGIEKYGATGGMVGVLDPKTGELLALVSIPSYDQQNYKDYSEDLYKNPFISNFYEPGSTFKALIMAASLDAQAVKPDTKCDICAGPIQIGEYKIKTWNDEYYNNTTMLDTIIHSDNTGMVFVGRKLGLEKMLSYLNKFGIGKLTGIDLQGEVSNSLRERNQWYPIDLATASFGQGISVTPIQLLSAFASIANNGQRMEPHVVSKIKTAEGEVIEIPKKVLGQPISEKTAKVMTEILVNAVEKGEAKWTKLKGYRIAGKTGTSQIPIAGHYDPNKTIASFIGFGPAENPKFAMLVILDRPTTRIYGSETAAPIFFQIARHILDYYKILPSE